MPERLIFLGVTQIVRGVYAIEKFGNTGYLGFDRQGFLMRIGHQQQAQVVTGDRFQKLPRPG